MPSKRYLLTVIGCSVSAIILLVCKTFYPFQPFLINSIVRYLFTFIFFFSFWALTIFMFGINPKIGFSLILVGVTTNCVAVMANGGLMPAGSYEANLEAGLITTGYTSLTNANLVWICDWIGERASPGDVIIWVGCIVSIVYSVIRYRRSKREDKV